MPATFVVDQAATFGAVVLLSCEPKLGFGSTEQDKDKATGQPKWEAQVVAGFRDQFGRTSNEVLKIGLLGDRNPCDAVPQFTPVRLRNFVVGVMEKRGRDGEIVGVQTWYRAEGIEPIGAVPDNGRKPEHAPAA